MLKEDTFDWIKSTFLKLTSKTYPFGFEEGLVIEMKKCGIFPNDLKEDQYGNYFYKIGDSKTVFASHLDTACQDQVTVNHRFDDEYHNEIIKTDGTSILGADDKAGVTLLLWMIKHNIPGLYYFFYGEEVGCLGSTAASSLVNEFSIYDRIISFDRRGTESVITHQSSTRTCSDEFAQSLSNQLTTLGLPYHKDDTGIYTDSAEFVKVISECTNISVGYYNEHTTTEKQDITHLTKLANAILLVDWENLPTSRDKTKIEYKSYSSSYSSGNNYQSIYSSRNKRTYLDEYDSEHDADDISSYSKKNSRSRRKRWKDRNTSQKVYFESGEDLIEISNKSDDPEKPNQYVGKYDILKSKFLDQSLNRHELEIIKDQYFDMNDPRDVSHYGYLIDHVLK